MCSKITLFSSSKREEKCTFIIEKHQWFFRGFRQFLLDIGFEKSTIINLIGCDDNETGPSFGQEQSIADYVDRRYCYGGQPAEPDVEVIYGAHKIFLIVYSASDRQDEIAKKILEFCEFKKA